MKFLDAIPPKTQTPRGSKLLTEKLERERRATERRERAIASLCDVDKVLARTLRVPSDYAERVAMARNLRHADDRTRTYREIGAIMGCSSFTISRLLRYPSIEEARRAEREHEEKRPRRSTSVDPARAAWRKTLKERADERSRNLGHEHIGEEMHKLRRRARVSRMELARRLDVSVADIDEWEKSESGPTPGMVPRIREALLDNSRQGR